MHRSTALLLSLLALTLSACGGDDEQDAPASAGGAPVANVSLAEAQGYLERGELALVREGLEDEGAPIATEIEPEPTTSRRLAAQNGRELDLLVFATPEEARAAWESVLEDTSLREEGGAAVRAVNLVAVFPRPPGEGTYARIRDALRALGDACRGPGGDPELRRLCFEGEDEQVPPAGEGTDADELAPIGSTVVVGDVAYRVTIARQLNPRIAPDEELVDGRRPEGDALLFGVFLQACNPEGGEPARATGRVALLDAFGARAEPVDLGADNPFAYRPATIEPGECLPQPGSVAERAVDGRLVLFEVPADRLENRPLGLEVVSPDGRDRATVQLDV